MKMRSDLLKMMQKFAIQEGPNETPIPGVLVMNFPRPDRPSKRQWRQCFAIIAQGAKEITLGSELYRCEVGHYTVSPLHLPVISRVAEPLLSLLIELDVYVMAEVAAQIVEPSSTDGSIPRAFFRGEADDRLIEAVTRLASLMRSPEESKILAPAIKREIYYLLLKGSEGGALRQFVRSGSRTHKISQAVHSLRSNLSEELDVGALAKAAGMGRSAFFKHFSEVTSMSPIQFQKRLRLLEAKRLMIEGETAERAAFAVGYKSAPQFSREYSRMFGDAPLRDIRKVAEKEGFEPS